MESSGSVVPFARYGASRGLKWFSQAYRMFRAAPLPWLLLLFGYYFILAVAELVPWSGVGTVIGAILKPVFAVGFLAAAWNQERGGKPSPRHLFHGFRSNLWALIPLGMVFLCGMALALLATLWVDDGKLIGMLSGTSPPTEQWLSAGRVQLPTVLALWFAPALVVFNDAGAITALATSLRAALANWRPAIVFGMTAFFYGALVPTLALTAARLFGATIATLIAAVVVLPYMLAFLATFQIADYVAYRDVFHADEPTAAKVGSETTYHH